MDAQKALPEKPRELYVTEAGKLVCPLELDIAGYGAP